MNEKLNLLADKIKAAHRIAVFGHANPDGDCLCSALAMARLIELNFGVTPVCLYDGNISDYLDSVPRRRFMHFHGRMTDTEPFDLVILVDVGVVGQLRELMPILDAAHDVVSIDHHRKDEPIGSLNFDDDAAAATGQIIFEMMRAAKWEYDTDTLNLMLIAIITDTGNFKFARAGSVLRVAADLVDFGADMVAVSQMLVGRDRRVLLTQAAVASRAQFYYKNRLAIATVERRDYKYIDGKGDLILSLLGQINGVEYVVLLKQQKEDQIGVSLRSKSAPVNEIATLLGGGGHLNAAGAVVGDTLENVTARVLELFKGK